MKRPNSRLSLFVPDDDSSNNNNDKDLDSNDNGNSNNDDDVVDYREDTAPSTSSTASSSYSSQITAGEEEDDSNSNIIDGNINNNNKTKKRRRRRGLIIIRRWHLSFKRSLKRRARRALREKKVPKPLYPFLDMLLKKPDQILYSPYSLRIGRICLMLSSISLIAGKNWTSFILSCIAFLIFRLAKKISQCIFLDKWVYISFTTLLMSFISLLCLKLSMKLSKWHNYNYHNHYHEISSTLWIVGYSFQKLCGYILGYYMYRHVENLHFLEIHIKILEFRHTLSSSSSPLSSSLSKESSQQQQHYSNTTIYSRHRNSTNNTTTTGTYHQHQQQKFPIDLYHGGAKLAHTNDQARKRIKFAVMSLSLEEHKDIKCNVNTPTNHQHSHSPSPKHSNNKNKNKNKNIPASSSSSSSLEEDEKEKQKQQPQKQKQPKHHHRKRIGTANIAIPEMRNVKMTNLFDVLDQENNNSKGQLLIEIEIRPQSSYF